MVRQVKPLRPSFKTACFFDVNFDARTRGLGATCGRLSDSHRRARLPHKTPHETSAKDPAQDPPHKSKTFRGKWTELFSTVPVNMASFLCTVPTLNQDCTIVLYPRICTILHEAFLHTVRPMIHAPCETRGLRNTMKQMACETRTRCPENKDGIAGIGLDGRLQKRK